MKESTRVLIESGVIPQSVVNICRIWNGSDEAPASSEGQKTQGELLEMVSKIATLLEETEELPEVRESELDLDKAIKFAHLNGELDYRTNSGQAANIKMPVGFTRAGKLAVKAVTASMRLCERFALKNNVIYLSDGRTMRITHVEPRYTEERLSHYVCDVENADA